MRLRDLSSLALAVLLHSVVPAAVASGVTHEPGRVRVAAAPEVRDALKKLDIWLEGQRLKHDLPGFSAGVVHDQELLWSRGYGYADLTSKVPATDQTLYRVASITKTFTATAVMQLAEQGKLSLEDAVSQHLEWFTPKDADEPIRIWHLLSHTAGLRREPPGTDWDALRYPDENTLRTLTPETPLSLPAQTRLKYSNYGFTVAGELISKVSGVPYVQYVQERILNPLGMTNTLFLAGKDTAPGLAVPYGRRLPGQVRAVEAQIERQGLLSAGGLVSCVRDLAKWASLQFHASENDSGPVLTGRSLREMHRPRLLTADWSQGWGIGWRLNRGEKRARMDHGGSLPGYKSSLMIDPASRVAVILLFNADDGPRELTAEALKIVSEPITKAAASSSAVAATPDLARFEGLYRSRSGYLTRAIVLGGKLRLISLEADDVDAATITLKQTGASTFVTEARDNAITFGVESIVEFKTNDTGRAVSVSLESGAYGMQRVE